MQSPLDRLLDMQTGLQALMEALKNRDYDKAEQILLQLGAALDQAINAEEQR